MHKYSRVDGGFTLIEMLVVLLIAGILATIAVPSLISQKKSMRSAISQTETMLKTVNLVARANAGNPYRIRPVYNAGTDLYQLRVESRRNGNCTLTDKWIGDNNKFVDLPKGIIVTDEDGAALVSLATKTLCFDSRGSESSGGKIFSITDTTKESKVYRARIAVSAVGDVSKTTFNDLNNPI